MRAKVLVGSLASFGVGVITAVQSRVNGELAVITGNGLQAATVSMVGSFLIASVLVIVVPRWRRGLRAVGSALRAGRLAWWQLLGGLSAALFLATQSLTVPVIGVAVFTVALVAGQLGNSIVVDRLGWGPAGVQGVTTTRVLSAVIALAAVVIAVSDRWTGQQALALLPVLLAIVAGTGMAIQQALNGHVALESRDPIAASWVNFTVGLGVLVVVFLGLWAATDIDPGPIPWDRPYLLLGGIVGVLFIATAAWVVQIVGILFFALLTILGQLVGAAVLDVVLPTTDAGFRWTILAGVIVAAAAVLIGALPRLTAAWRGRSRRRRVLGSGS